jgi:hypothetical protein
MASDDTEKKEGGTQLFQAGQSGNPTGRPRGARNRLGEEFLKDLLKSWEDNGPDVIKKVIAKKPEVYLKVVASLLPKDLNINVHKIGELSDEQLLERLRKLDAAIQPFIASHGEDGDSAGDRAPTAH